MIPIMPMIVLIISTLTIFLAMRIKKRRERCGWVEEPTSIEEKLVAIEEEPTTVEEPATIEKPIVEEEPTTIEEPATRRQGHKWGYGWDLREMIHKYFN